MGLPWTPWDHSTTCTTSSRSVLLHNHAQTHTHTVPSLSKPVVTFSLIYCPDPVSPKKKKTHPGCCVTPGEAANCGLFTVSCPPGAWSLEPWLKRIQPLLQSARRTHSSGWNCIDTKRQAHIDTKWYRHSVIMQGEKKQAKLVVLADKS